VGLLNIVFHFPMGESNGRLELIEKTHRYNIT